MCNFCHKSLFFLFLSTTVFINTSYCAKRDTCQDILSLDIQEVDSSFTENSLKKPAGESQSQSWQPSESPEVLSLQEPEGWMIEREAATSGMIEDKDSHLVLFAEESTHLQEGGRNGIYEVLVDGKRRFFKPSLGESFGVGMAYLGEGFQRGMMSERDVFATQLFKEIGWEESSRASMVLLVHNGKLEGGALIERLPGISMAEFGMDRFTSEIALQESYRQSQERAVVMATVLGNQDWISSKNGKYQINSGNLLLSEKSTQEGVFNFYWIDNGAACPLWARVPRSADYLLAPGLVEEHIQQALPLLWPLVEQLGGKDDSLDKGTLRLIKNLNRLSFLDFMKMTQDLRHITNDDINGIIIRIHYLYERFVSKSLKSKGEEASSSLVDDVLGGKTWDQQALDAAATAGGKIIR